MLGGSRSDRPSRSCYQANDVGLFAVLLGVLGLGDRSPSMDGLVDDPIQEKP
jgi:hypothetical protein